MLVPSVLALAEGVGAAAGVDGLVGARVGAAGVYGSGIGLSAREIGLCDASAADFVEFSSFLVNVMLKVVC